MTEQVDIDYTREDDNFTRTYFLETDKGLVKFHGQIRTSDPALDRYLANINGEKKIVYYNKTAKTLELIDFD